MKRTKRTSGKWCPVCGYKMKGELHDLGKHHQAALRKQRSK